MRYATLFLILGLSTGLFAQPGEITEQSIQAEKDFIEAKREALLGKTEKAGEMFRVLVENYPDQDAFHFELGRLLYADGDNDGAIDAVRKAYGQRQSEVYAAFLAELYQAGGRYRDGAALYEGLIRRNPSAEGYYLERAAFLVRAQEVKEAIAVYDQLEKRIGVNPELTRRKHALYLGQGDAKRAEKELLNLIEVQPEVLDHRHLLAGFYTSQNEAGKARKTYEEILRRQPADVRAQLALQEVSPAKPTAAGDGELLALLGRTDVDIDLKVGKILPLVQQLARTQDAGQGQRAMALAAELRRVHPDEAKAAAIQGDIYFHTGQLTKAADAYRATLELDDTVYPVWEQLLATLYLDNQITELRRYAEEALDIFPNRPGVYVQYALGEALRADFDEAGSLLEQARLMVSGQPAAASQLEALAEAFAGLSEGSSPKLDLDLLPGGKEGPLGYLLGNAGNLSALRAYDTPGNTNALFLEYLGDALAESGDKAGSAEAYRRAKAAGSKSGTLR